MKELSHIHLVQKLDFDEICMLPEVLKSMDLVSLRGSKKVFEYNSGFEIDIKDSTPRELAKTLRRHTYFYAQIFPYNKIYDAYYVYDDGSKEQVFILDKDTMLRIYSVVPEFKNSTSFERCKLFFDVSSDARKIIFSDLKCIAEFQNSMLFKRGSAEYHLVTPFKNIVILGDATQFFYRICAIVDLRNVDFRFMTVSDLMFDGFFFTPITVKNFINLDLRNIMRFESMFGVYKSMDLDLSDWILPTDFSKIKLLELLTVDDFNGIMLPKSLKG